MKGLNINLVSKVYIAFTPSRRVCSSNVFTFSEIDMIFSVSYQNLMWGDHICEFHASSATAMTKRTFCIQTWFKSWFLEYKCFVCASIWTYSSWCQKFGYLIWIFLTLAPMKPKLDGCISEGNRIKLSFWTKGHGYKELLSREFERGKSHGTFQEINNHFQATATWAVLLEGSTCKTKGTYKLLTRKIPRLHCGPKWRAYEFRIVVPPICVFVVLMVLFAHNCSSATLHLPIWSFIGDPFKLLVVQCNQYQMCALNTYINHVHTRTKP